MRWCETGLRVMLPGANIGIVCSKDDTDGQRCKWRSMAQAVGLPEQR
jgi:hypothetical protein